MEFIRKNKFLLCLIVLALVCLCFSCGHCSNPYIDVGREMYYPKAILENKILYKDLFCIYGPLSYLVNALLYKIFGIKLTSLYFGGVISSISIVALIYLISKKFLPEVFCFTIGLFVVGTGCLATRIFNFTLPYCYAVVYGLVCFLASIYLLILYDGNKKEKFLLMSGVFAGLSVANKYDFVLYLVPFFAYLIKTKNFKIIIKTLLLAFVSILIPFIILFIQGLRIEDLLNTFSLIKNFTQTLAIKTFYVTQGVYYTDRLWADWLYKVFLLGIWICFGYFGFVLFSKNRVLLKALGVFLIIFGVLLPYFFSHVGSYLFLTFLVFMLLLIFNRRNSYIENIFIISSLLVSLKSFWGLSHGNYGLYYAGVILICFFILITKISSKNFQFALLLVLFGMTLNYADANIFWIKGEGGKINTDKGYIKTIDSYSETLNELISYMNNLEEEKYSLIVFPEGLSVNFLLKKQADAPYFYSSLIPLYTEGFGEDKIIQYYKNRKPDYIVLSDLEAESYGYGSICVTYAEKICSFIRENYIPVKNIIGKNDAFVILKKR